MVILGQFNFTLLYRNTIYSCNDEKMANYFRFAFYDGFMEFISYFNLCDKPIRAITTRTT